jgi:hypothetical protein
MHVQMATARPKSGPEGLCTLSTPAGRPGSNEEYSMAGISVLTDATVPDGQVRDAAATRLWRFCRAQPELAGLAIGALLSAPLVAAVLLSA